MKKFLSVFLVSLFIISLAACSTDNKSDYEMPSEKSLNASEIQNEAIKTLVGDGRLVSQIENDLPTTLGLIRDIAGKAEYRTTIYDELSARVRNISKYILGNVLETSSSLIAQTGSYTFVKVSGTSYADEILIALDDSNRVYRVMMFNDGEKDYCIYKGEYNDFSNEYFYKNKKYVELSCPKFVVLEETNEALMCSYSFPIGENESVDVFHDENGEMLYCCDKTGQSAGYFNSKSNVITSDEAERLEEEFKERINKKYGIELLK